MVSAMSWVPKGISKSVLPGAGILYVSDGHIYIEEEEDEQDMEVEASDDITDSLKELNMDKYDEEDTDIQIFDKGMSDSYYPSDEDGEEFEEEEWIIQPDDLVIVCAGDGHGGFGLLEVYTIFEAKDGTPHTDIHHDYLISAYPLSTAWLDCDCLLKNGEKGSFIAVGSLLPTIEIWDLDIIDGDQPCATMYQEGHTESVMGLAWNKEVRNILASASADKLVKIWDVATGKCSITMDHHTNKVQAVAWNRQVPEILLSGSSDHSVVLKDGRKPSHSGYKYSVDVVVECLAWDPHAEHSFVVSLDNGMIQGFDIRTASSDPEAKQRPSFTLHAHEEAVYSISYNPAAPNLLATGSADQMVKLWDLSNFQPSCVASHDPKALKAGAVFSVSFCDDKPFLLAIGASKERLQVWDALSEDAIAKKYGESGSKSSS